MCASLAGRSPAPLEPALAAENASPVERVAGFVAGLAIERHGPGRVVLPVPIASGAAGVWRCGLYAFREVLFYDRPPAGPGFLAADGLSGAARARGSTREAALRPWRKRVEELRPFPEPPKAPPARPRPPWNPPPGYESPPPDTRVRDSVVRMRVELGPPG